MKHLPRKNWFNDIAKAADYYKVDIDEDSLKLISKDSFKHTVKEAVKRTTFDKLKHKCQQQSKTKSIVYHEYRIQPFFSRLLPSQYKVIVKCRAKCLKNEEHRQYLFKDSLCRWCYLAEETLEHILNCGREDTTTFLNLDILNEVDSGIEAGLIILASRVEQFLDMVNY